MLLSIKLPRIKHAIELALGLKPLAPLSPLSSSSHPITPMHSPYLDYPSSLPVGGQALPEYLQKPERLVELLCSCICDGNMATATLLVQHRGTMDAVLDLAANTVRQISSTCAATLRDGVEDGEGISGTSAMKVSARVQEKEVRYALASDPLLTQVRYRRHFSAKLLGLFLFKPL